jgi:hypothetical protein
MARLQLIVLQVPRAPHSRFVTIFPDVCQCELTFVRLM